MDLTVILDDLAAGRIDAAEAKHRIDALGPTTAGPEEPHVSTEWPEPPQESSHATWPSMPNPASTQSPTAESSTPPREPDGFVDDTPPKADKINGVSKILIKATGRKVRVLADTAVSTAAAEDVHQVKRQGSTLEVIGDKEFSGVIDAMSWVKSVRGLDDVKALGIGKELTIRVNPTLEVDIELTGSSLQVTDIPHIGKVRLTAGVASISGTRVISDLLLQAGQATVTGRFTDGWSRFRCESGQIIVEAEPGSDVVLHADAQLGRISWEGQTPTDNEVTLGRGNAHLDIGVVVGHAVVKTPA
jgi:hypothetical protein